MPRRFFLVALALLGFGVSQARAQELLSADTPIEKAVDHYIDALLQQEKVKPAQPTPPAELLRRLTLDLAGRIPSLPETDAYLASNDLEKKVQLVDRLMASSGFVRHNVQEFAALFYTDEGAKKGARRTALNDYLQKSFAENRTWDRIFREILLPDDAEPKTQGSGEFLKSRIKDLNRLTIDTSTIFFGVNVSCAQCHDHPHVGEWTQDIFYGMKGFFARTFDNGGMIAEYDAGQVKYIPNKGTEKVAPVMFLTGKKLDVPNIREPNGDEKKNAQERINEAKKAKKTPAPPSFSVRTKFVDTALEPGQREVFARAIVNRLWYRYFGRGLVMPLDQMHRENPPSHPQLLDWLARDLVDHGYDLRRLTRGLVLSNAYARSSRWEGEKAPEGKLFAVAQARALTPMQMAASLKVATTDPQSLPESGAEAEKRFEAIEKSAEGLAAFFPRPNESFQVGVSEAMLFANNEGLQKQLLEGGDNLVARIAKESGIEKRADLAVRAVLSRPPVPSEVKAISDYLRQREDRPVAGCQQVVWALLTSAEFRFNH